MIQHGVGGVTISAEATARKRGVSWKTLGYNTAGILLLTMGELLRQKATCSYDISPKILSLGYRIHGSHSEPS
jgi:hypothetical protein